MQEEQIAEILFRERKCSREEAQQVIQLLDTGSEKDPKKQALALWDAIFGPQSRNFGLSQTEFEQMAELLKNGDQQLFERIFLHHFKPCMQFLMHFKHCSHTNAYDATMNTLLEFRQMILDDKLTYGNLRYLFTRIAVFRVLKMTKKETNFVSDEFLKNTPTEQNDIDPESLHILSLALEKLKEECKQLLKMYYYDKIPWAQIAELLQTNAANARKRGERCREQLLQEFNNLS